jgi:hypothetical protein
MVGGDELNAVEKEAASLSMLSRESQTISPNIHVHA